MSRKFCPRCGGWKVIEDRRPNGFTECRGCELRLPTFAWKQLLKKIARAKKGEVITLDAGPLSEAEAAIKAQRNEELWSRLERVLPEGSSGFFGKGDEIDLTAEETVREVKLIISNFIGGLEARGEIPHGLIVSRIVPNPDRLGHLSVQLGLAEDCKREDREALLGYLTGRLSFI